MVLDKPIKSFANCYLTLKYQPAVTLNEPEVAIMHFFHRKILNNYICFKMHTYTYRLRLAVYFNKPEVTNISRITDRSIQKPFTFGISVKKSTPMRPDVTFVQTGKNNYLPYFRQKFIATLI